MPKKSEIIILDPKSRLRLEELGRCKGSPVIDSVDIDSPKGNKIIETLPILKNIFCGLKNPSVRNLELLRQFSQRARPNTTLWASVRMDDAGQIQSIDAPVNVELAQALLNNPAPMIDQISKSIDAHISDIPQEWLAPSLTGGRVGAHFSEMGADLAELDAPGLASEKVGPKLSHYLFDVILVLKMLATVQKGKSIKRQNARLFLKDLVESSAPYLRLMSKHTQISLASYHVLYTLFILVERANKAIGGRPLDYSIHPPPVSFPRRSSSYYFFVPDSCEG